MKVLVTNIPVQGYVEGYVEVPAAIVLAATRDNNTEDDRVGLRVAVRVALKASGYVRFTDSETNLEVESDVLDSGFELASPLWSL